VRCKTERGDREDRDGVLTSGGGRRHRPDFAGQPRLVGELAGSVRAPGAAALAAAARRAAARRGQGQGRARRGS
jgi:hypothetical protein